MFYVVCQLSNYIYENPAAESATMATLYRTGKSIVRNGRRNGFKVSFAVYDYSGHVIGRELFRVYNRVKGGSYSLCRHSCLGVYGGQNGYNF